ncbi:TPA: dTMP kinase [archaeon]|uniref:Probable thymidylate kinase n=1 Tax=Candidatus Naiadarchaeum limnaeum TaxID=2756139 RepID=A0A832UNH7_9ARCH|nr:dTMP kinase [Candidatus Naiadarchaeales archaeon SRR2090153.bin1042]HIK00434.1 dTMP kinase [Candidatus Naiadarchaeum limnaeum]
MSKGKFIVLEGIDKSGKSTHSKLLVKFLRKKFSTIHTKEPSRGPIGLLLRKYLRKDSLPLIDALLFTADRVEHQNSVVVPALKKGKVVVQERSFYSTIAYQQTQGLNEKWLRALNSFALKPNLVILLDINPRIALKRIRGKEKFETLNFLYKVRKNYLALARKEKFTIIRADMSKKAVQAEIRNAVGKLL